MLLEKLTDCFRVCNPRVHVEYNAAKNLMRVSLRAYWFVDGSFHYDKPVRNSRDRKYMKKLCLLAKVVRNRKLMATRTFTLSEFENDYSLMERMEDLACYISADLKEEFKKYRKKHERSFVEN